MAGSRKPGPQCSYNDRVDIDDGTMCVAKSPRPGPLGVRSRPSLINNESFERLIEGMEADATEAHRAIANHGNAFAWSDPGAHSAPQLPARHLVFSSAGCGT